MKVIVDSPRTSIIAPSAAALVTMAMRNVRSNAPLQVTSMVERRLELADGRTLQIGRDGSVSFTVERSVS